MVWVMKRDKAGVAESERGVQKNSERLHGKKSVNRKQKKTRDRQSGLEVCVQ